MSDSKENEATEVYVLNIAVKKGIDLPNLDKVKLAKTDGGMLYFVTYLISN